MQLEIACFNVASALLAAEAGADRIELCAKMKVGGITPTLDDFLSVKEQVAIPIYVMIRPRGGDFVYAEEEFETMQEQLLRFRKVGADGFVFGVLDEKNQVAVSDCKELLALANGVPCTFHRAIDRAENIQKAFEEIIALGFESVLSSGGMNSVRDGLETLVKLQEQYGNDIDLMPGGGVRSANIAEIGKKLQTRWLHSSGIVSGQLADFDEIRAMKSYSTSS